MNLCRCSNGHFYDKEKYATCPHCANGGGADTGRTFAFDQADDMATMPITGSQMDFAEPTPAPAPMPTPMPISGMNANDLTMPSDNGGGYVDEPTVPLVNPFPGQTPGQAPAQADEDDDHTIGFFDSDFFGSDITTPQPAAPVAKTPAVPKLSSPCVGWLVAIGGKHIGTDFRLKVGKNYVGRNSNMDICLPEDKSVSREKHAVVVYEPKNHMYFVQPGESSSLVYKNDEIVLTPMLLKAYDIITIGEVNLMFIPLCGEVFNWTALFEEMKENAK